MGAEPSIDPILRIEPVPDVARTLLMVAGELDIASAPQLIEALDAAASRGVVVLDLAQLQFVDASGLRVIVEARRRLGSRLELRDPSPPVLRLLRLTGLTEELLDAGTSASASGRPDHGLVPVALELRG